MKKNPSKIEQFLDLGTENSEKLPSLLNQLKALQCVNQSNILPFIEAKLTDIYRLKKLDTEMNDDDWITLNSDLNEIKDAVLQFIDEVRDMHGGNGPIKASDNAEPSRTIYRVKQDYPHKPEKLELKPNTNNSPHSAWMNHSGRQSQMKPARKQLALRMVVNLLKELNEQIDGISDNYQEAKTNKMNAEITKRQGEVTRLVMDEN